MYKDAHFLSSPTSQYSLTNLSKCVFKSSLCSIVVFIFLDLCVDWSESTPLLISLSLMSGDIFIAIGQSIFFSFIILNFSLKRIVVL